MGFFNTVSFFRLNRDLTLKNVCVVFAFVCSLFICLKCHLLNVVSSGVLFLDISVVISVFKLSKFLFILE